MIILFSSMMFLLSKNSMVMICSLMMMIISSTFLMIKTMKMVWMSYMILMLTVGGMMILYIFIISLNSNEKISLKINKSTLIMLPLSVIILLKNKPQENMQNSNFIINLNSNLSFIISMTTILTTMMLLSKISINPFTPSKSIK